MKLQATPNLFRAVAECTQPYGPPASGAFARLLQSYLSNERCVDSVYRAILARATAEPQSEAVVSRCIALIKQYVSRYPPSTAVLEAIAAACHRLAAPLPPASGLRKSLVYLEASVASSADAAATSRMPHFHARSASSSSPRPWLQAAVNGDINRSRGSTSFSVHSSTSADDAQSRQAPPSPVRGTFEQQLQLQLQQQQGFGSTGAALPQHEEEGDESDGDGDSSEQQLQEQAGFRVLGDQAGLPDWTFQPSALQVLWCHQPDSELAELDWSLLLPHYSPSLVPIVEGLPGMEVLHMLSSQDMIDDVTDADQQTMLRQMREVTEVRRIQAGVTDELIQQAVKQSSTSRARRLFHPLPYTQQEHMHMNSTDVAAVVEIMCGKQSPAVPSAITGTVGLDDPRTYWQQQSVGPQQQPLLLLYQQPGQQQQQSHAESIGQISSCILMKLIVDLWLTAGGETAFPLVLRMLQQALYQSQAEYRAMAFDIIYNLSLHGTMLMATHSSRPGSPVVQTQQGGHIGAAAAELRALQHGSLQQQQQYQQDLQQLALLQRLQPTQGRYDLSDPAAAADGGREQGSPSGSVTSGEGGDLSGRGSPDSNRGSVGSRSGRSSPRIHLPHHLLAPPHQQQQPAAVPQLSSTSPVPSPKGRSRLSRSELRVSADQQQQQQRRRQSSTSSFRGSSGGGAAAAAVGSTRASADPLDTTVEVDTEAGSDRGAASSRGEVPMEITWEIWLQQLLYELLLMLAMLDEGSESVWQSAVGCLFHLTTHGGFWVASSLHSLPPAAAAALLDASVKFIWSQELHARLVQMAVNLLYVTDAGPAAVSSPVAAAAVAVAEAGGSSSSAGQGSGGKPWQQPPRSQSPSRWQQQQQRRHKNRSADDPQQQQHQHQQQQGEAEQEGSDSASDEVSQHRSPSRRSSFRNSLRASIGSSHRLREGHSAAAVLDLPCQLHAGPVDEGQLAAFGGAQQLVKHFRCAGSIDAQRTLLVPLLQVLMPADAPDASQLAILQALCSSPNCLAALQVTLSAGLPGWADGILSAVTQLLDDQDLDLQLLSTVLLRLEDLTVAQLREAPPAAAGSLESGACDVAAATAVDGTADEAVQKQQLGSSTEPADGNSSAAAVPRVVMLPEVATAMQVTLQQLAGRLQAQQVSRPGPDGTEIMAYQVQTEVQGCWKALKALCWCDDESARRVLRRWLQQLLAVTLQQSYKNAIQLPTPGVTQQPAPPADTPSTAISTADRAAAGPAVTAAVHAACDSWADILQQLVTHCPQGSNTLVDALQLQVTSFKLHLSNEVSGPGAAAAAGTEGPAAAAESGTDAQLKQRAAVARMCVQGWAFVSQWVLQARTSVSHTALTRLAAIAQTLACVHEVPDWIDATVLPGAADNTAAGGEEKGVNNSRDMLSSIGGTSGLPATSISEAGSDLALPMPPTACPLNREEDPAFKGVPPLEPSSEPSALAALLAAEGRGGAEGVPAGSAAGQGAAAAAAEAVCWPQAFLLGRALLPQQMAQVLAGSSLALLLVRLLQCKQPGTAAERGFQGRPCSISNTSHSKSAESSQTAAAGGQCPVLFPWSDDRQDLQLGLLLMLLSSCGSDANSFKDFGLEAVTQRVLSGCNDPRACLLVSQFKLDYLMRHQQNYYWSSLRKLVAAAQKKNDEKLLGNPFLQLITLLSMEQEEAQQQEKERQQKEQKQQQQQPGSSASVSPSQAAIASASSGRAGPASH